MGCNPEDCGYCRKSNPKAFCTKLGMEIEKKFEVYNQFFCGVVEKGDEYESRKI